jgi:DNA-directed RNA polymerase subunit RPC12/RpoP
MNRKCVSCGEEVGFTEYWSWVNNENLEADVKFVCTKCMEGAVGTTRLVAWCLGH